MLTSFNKSRTQGVLKMRDCNIGMIYGNKGNVFENTCHWYGIKGNLCGTPALATNWARIEKVKKVGCPECLKELERIKEIMSNKLCPHCNKHSCDNYDCE